MVVSFESLRKVQLQERKAPSLSGLGKDFYSECRSYFSELDSRGSPDALRELSNARDVLKNVFFMRRQKLLWKVLRDLENNTVSSEDLASEEKQLYTSVLKLLNDFESSVASVPNPVSFKPDLVEAKFLADLHEFVWIDSVNYGPFKQGEVVQLKKELSVFLKEKSVIEVELVE
mgnify:CR=1 FL=1